MSHVEEARLALALLERVHRQRIRLAQKEAAILKDLARSPVRGVRTGMARILGVSTEALRQRYGPVQSVRRAKK